MRYIHLTTRKAECMNRRIIQYDSIRLWSTFFIILCHLNVYIVQNTIGDGKPLFYIPFKSGDTTAMAVSLFFIISGASLMTKYGSTNRSFKISEYYINRFLGVYPFFWIAWIMIYGYMIASGNFPLRFQTISKWKCIFTVLAVDGFVAEYFGENFYLIGEWFLGSIIILYLFFPLLLYIKKRSTIIFVMLIIGCYFIGVALSKCGVNTYTFPLTRTIEFGFGMIFQEYRDKFSKVKIPFFLCAVCIIMFFFFVSVPVFYMHIYVLFGAASFIILYYISELLIRNPIYSDICTRFAGISFSVYLLHHHILAIIMSKYFGYPLLRREMYMMLLIVLMIIVFLGYWVNGITKKVISWLESYSLRKGV